MATASTLLGNAGCQRRPSRCLCVAAASTPPPASSRCLSRLASTSRWTKATLCVPATSPLVWPGRRQTACRQPRSRSHQHLHFCILFPLPRPHGTLQPTWTVPFATDSARTLHLKGAATPSPPTLFPAVRMAARTAVAGSRPTLCAASAATINQLPTSTHLGTEAPPPWVSARGLALLHLPPLFPLAVVVLMHGKGSH